MFVVAVMRRTAESGAEAATRAQRPSNTKRLTASCSWHDSNGKRETGNFAAMTWTCWCPKTAEHPKM
jgi:hypothetical protein